MVMITTGVGPGRRTIVQMSEEAYEAHEAMLAKDARRRAFREAIIRGLNPFIWLRQWSERRSLKDFMRGEEARLGTALQAIDFALDGTEEEAGDPMDRLEFLKAWREGDDLAEWAEYQPAAIGR